MRLVGLLAIIVCLPWRVRSQNQQIFSCTYGVQSGNPANCINVSSSLTQDLSAIQTIDKILEPIGLKRNFVLISCTNVNNAIALTSQNGTRYIIYDNNFMSSLARLSSSWANASILAHEIGHHLLGHTLKASTSLAEQRQKELDADEFSGFILFKLGASLQQAQATLAVISDNGLDINSTHPARDKRLAAVKVGYDKASNGQIVKYVKTGPSAEEFFAQGYRLTDEKRFEEALESYNMAIGLNRNFAEAYLNRAHVRLQMPFSKIKMSDVKNDCVQALRLNPKLGAAYYNKGLAEMIEADYDNALNDFDQAIKLDPSLDGHHFFLNRNFVKLKIEERSKGVAQLTNDLQKNPQNDGAFFDRGFRLMEKGQLAEAISDFTKAIQINRKNPAYYDLRGLAKGKLQDIQGAIKDFDTSIRLNPNIPLSYFNRGQTYKTLNDFDKALSDFNMCVVLEPENQEYLIARGYVRRQVEAYDEALEDFTKLIELNPRNDLAWLERAVTKAEMGKHKDAIDDLNKAISVNSNPDYLPYHYYHRGLCNVALGNKSVGCKDLKKSCELGLSEACNDMKNYCR